MDYYKFEDLLADVTYLQKRYTGLVECETIGYSVLGRPIIMLRFGCGYTNMFISAGVHGRESINPRLLMKIMKLYVDTYHNKSEYRQYSFYIIPVLNPDGYIMAISDTDYYEYKFNANGIDINRDFPCVSWKKSSVTDDEPASQPETRALISAFKSHPSVMYVDIHSRGNSIYYYRNFMPEQYNIRQKIMADIMCNYTGYKLMQPESEISEGDSGGNTVHYYSEHFGMPAFTIETAEEEASFPMNQILIEEVFDNTKHLPEAMIQSCHYI